MTMYTAEGIEQMAKDLVGKKVTEFYYEEDEDYYVLSFEDGGEISFRFMSDCTPSLSQPLIGWGSWDEGYALVSSRATKDPDGKSWASAFRSVFDVPAGMTAVIDSYHIEPNRGGDAE